MPGSDDPVSELFSEFLLRQEGGEDVDLDAFCAEHPDAADELRRLHEDWRHAAGVLARLGRGASVASRVRERYGPDVDPGVELEPADGPEASGDFASETIGRLSGRLDAFGRYTLQGELARGGQGAILRVWDEDLRRNLVMKVILGEAGPPGATPPVDSKTLSRFLEEAQVTAQLDHPGIVPVHELGLDALGRVYFTMKLVKGRDLREIFRLLREGSEGWTRTRALGVLLKVCEAMAYAHAKGVIHRDLKPANVMVGNYGEVYVMDWGLARVVGRTRGRDVRIRPELATTVVRSGRHPQESEADSPLVTMDGDIVGTPVYMAPEQALGQLDEMGPHSDVYAAGAMLYELLAGHQPYVEPGMRLTNYAVLVQVQKGPPTPLHRAAPDAPPELVAICEKAMARDPADRYPDTLELAEDLRAFLEHRVVRAYETGAVAELRKWVGRNRRLAAAMAAAVLATIGALGAVAYFQARETHLAEARAEEGRRVLRLSAFRALEDLEREADALWPANRGNAGAYAAWLLAASELIAGLVPDPSTGDPGHLRQLATLRARALPRRPAPALAFVGDAAELAALERDVAALRGRIEALAADPAQAGAAPRLVALEQLRAELRAPGEWSFAEEEDVWWHDQLTELVLALLAFADGETGLVLGVSPEHGWGIARRLARAAAIEEASLDGPAARRRWAEARAAIRAHPGYGGLDLAPQWGLLPLGPDPDSGLWEFCHLATGAEPARDDAGRLVPAEESGMVLVLLPGGTFWMGAQAGDPAKPNHDPGARDDEGPVHPVSLSPFFLSKYELTQGQWLRFGGSNPSGNSPDRPDRNAAGRPIDLSHPVENVSWAECDRLVRRLGLVLPTEAQWEYAARAGTDTVWWCGDDSGSLAGVANLADAFADLHTATWVCEPWDDGHVFTAAVGSFRANAFGLHDVHGNVWEWCLDAYEADVYAPGALRVDPSVEPGPVPRRVGRGGGYDDTAVLARCAERGDDRPDYRSSRLGLRPARAIEP